MYGQKMEKMRVLCLKLADAKTYIPASWPLIRQMP